jgi:cytidylate kinase
MFQIAIDGPSGAGKSSVAKLIAARMGIVYVDTGALYRTIGYFVRGRGIARTDIAGIISCLPHISIEVRYEDGAQHVYLNGEDLGDRIREPEISMYASAVSAVPEVRTFLLDTQRDIARKNSVIMDGRDIGTVILPEADVKVFLTASNEARALRRTKELEQKGMPANYEDVLREMIERDNNDRNREVAPAVAAEDAVLMDNSDMTVSECADAIIALVEAKAAEGVR